MIANLKEKAAGFDKRRLYTAFSALVIAAAAGVFMQRGADTPEPAAPMDVAAISETPAEAPEDVTKSAISPGLPLQPGASADALALDEAPAGLLSDPVIDTPLDQVAMDPVLPMPEPAPVSAAEPEAPARIAALGTAADLAEEPTAPAAGPTTAACDIRMEAAPVPGALVALSIEAPCNSGEAVEFAHAGLLFSEQLGPDGDLELLVPAMAEDAMIVAIFEDSSQQSTTVAVPDFMEFERVALVWQGPTGLQLHALENGATYGEPGHVWAEQPESPERALAGEGGFLSLLGSTATGYAADIYTYPAGLMAAGNAPEVSIEAQVMENTCGGKIRGNILRSNPGHAPTESDLMITVPGCDAVGEYLVLKNLPRDLKIARN